MANIFLDKKFDELLDEVSPKEGSDDEKTFVTLAQASCFAAALAFNDGKKFKKNLKINKGREIRDTVLDNKEFKIQIDMLSMASTENHEILQDTDDFKDQRYEIFQNFVNQGFDILLKKKNKNPTDTSGIDTVIQLMQEQSTKNIGKVSESELGKPDF